MAEARERLLGTDLLLVPYADGLDLTPRAGGVAGGDLALTRGSADEANIVQALTLRLRVRRGELALLGWPDYGSRLHELIGELNVARTHLRAQVFAREAIEADPRVAEVQEVRAAAAERDTVRILLEVLLIDRPTPMNLVFDFRLDRP